MNVELNFIPNCVLTSNHLDNVNIISNTLASYSTAQCFENTQSNINTILNSFFETSFKPGLCNNVQSFFQKVGFAQFLKTCQPEIKASPVSISDTFSLSFKNTLNEESFKAMSVALVALMDSQALPKLSTDQYQGLEKYFLSNQIYQDIELPSYFLELNTLKHSYPQANVESFCNQDNKYKTQPNYELETHFYENTNQIHVPLYLRELENAVESGDFDENQVEQALYEIRFNPLLYKSNLAKNYLLFLAQKKGGIAALNFLYNKLAYVYVGFIKIIIQKFLPLIADYVLESKMFNDLIQLEEFKPYLTSEQQNKMNEFCKKYNSRLQKLKQEAID